MAVQNATPFEVLVKAAAQKAGSNNDMVLQVTSDSLSGTFVPSGLFTNVKQSSFTVTDSAQPVPGSALSGRNSISIRIWGTKTVYFGAANVTPSNGYPKTQYEELAIDITDDPSVVIHAVCAAGESSEIRIMEVA